MPSSSLGKKLVLKDILDKKFDEKFWLKQLDNYDKSPITTTKSNISRLQLLNYTSFNSENYVYDKKTINGCTLTASGANSRIKILDNNKIRMMNSREAFRYMGFSTKDYNNVFKWDKYNLFSKSKVDLIFLAGNSIVVNVLEAIFLKMFLPKEVWHEQK